MKRITLTILNLFFVLIGSAQTDNSAVQSKGMVFVPQGTFQMNNKENSVTKSLFVTVDAFWMSNEITNEEFRNFIDWSNKNPNEKLYKVNYQTKVFNDQKKGSMKDSIVREIIPIDVSKINGLFDPLFLEKSKPNYKGYFTDPKYNDFPVVGVSFDLAEYYCLWKTMIEDKKIKGENSRMHTFRLPLEEEWEYVAQKGEKSNKEFSSIIKKVKDGSPNELDLFHFTDNVSEWVKSIREENRGVVRGGSWSCENSILFRTIKDYNTTDPSIGFRVVQSFTGENN